jgi:hypothetical protein
MADEAAEKKPDGTGSVRGADPASVSNAQAAAAAAAQSIPPGIPPIQPASIPGLMAIQVGMGMQQQNPEVMRYVTEFLSHDSDNRLRALDTSGSRNHQFRMTALGIGSILFVLVVVVPLVVQLMRGDLTFVNKLLTDYLPVIAAVFLALLAGSKLPDLFKG